MYKSTCEAQTVNHHRALCLYLQDVSDIPMMLTQTLFKKSTTDIAKQLQYLLEKSINDVLNANRLSTCSLRN